MGRKNIDTNIIKINEFLEKNEFKLLKSQREYKWGKEQIETFIDDFYLNFKEYQSLGEERDDVDFLIGSIYTISDSGYLSIIDGQQRTVSTLIILKVLVEEFIEKDKREKYYKYYKNKFLIEDVDRRKSELKYYDIAFGNLNNINDVFDEKNYSNIINNIFIAKKKIHLLKLNENEYLEFLDFILEKVNIINIIFYDYRLAFDTFIKVNARGIELTNLELLYSFIWTLNIREKEKENFSRKFNHLKNSYMNVGNKKIETKEKELEEGFIAAYKCFIDKRFYSPKDMFKILSKEMQGKFGDVLLNDIANIWFPYANKYYDLVNNSSSIYYKARKALKDAKRMEYCPILGYLNYYDNDFTKNDKKIFVDMIKLISYWSSIKETYLKEEKIVASSKFDSESLKFYELFNFVKDVKDGKKEIEHSDVSDFITKHMANFFQYFDECIEYQFSKKWIVDVLNEFVDLYDEYINAD